MAEDKGWLESDYAQEAKRIVREYLSGVMWNRTRRDQAFREVKPAVDREELEGKFRDFSSKEEDIEWKFGQEVDRWRKSPDANRKIVLEGIVAALHHRRDLGFFARRIVDRLKREIELR